MDLLRPAEEAPVSPLVALQSIFLLLCLTPEGKGENDSFFSVDTETSWVRLSDQFIHIGVCYTDWGQPSVHSVNGVSLGGRGRKKPLPANQLQTTADKPEAWGCHLMSLWFFPRRLMQWLGGGCATPSPWMWSVVGMSGSLIHSSINSIEIQRGLCRTPVLSVLDSFHV